VPKSSSFLIGIVRGVKFCKLEKFCYSFGRLLKFGAESLLSIISNTLFIFKLNILVLLVPEPDSLAV